MTTVAITLEIKAQTVLEFPCEEKIISYLRNHPAISNLCEDVILAVADIFAYSQQSKQIDIDRVVAVVLEAKRETLKLTSSDYITTCVKLSGALSACLVALGHKKGTIFKNTLSLDSSSKKPELIAQ